MALLFQSNPDHWDLRGHFVPGEYVSWFVSRYKSLMLPGVLVLLWESQGSQRGPVKGLYGWGVTVEELRTDTQGRPRIRLRYVERWVSREDSLRKTPIQDHAAPVGAEELLSLPSWQDHLLNLMPIGTNFLVSPEQLEELSRRIVEVKFPGSEFPRAVALDVKGEPLDPSAFKITSVVAAE